MVDQDQPFWRRKKLTEMTQAEWESLCDGCARCCLHKLQDIDTGEIFYTNVVCHLLDMHTGRCTQYSARTELIKTCIQLTPELAGSLKWLPPTCAYRRLAEGKDLEWWHPLVSGDPNIIYELGISVRGSAIPDSEVDMDALEDYIVDDLDSVDFDSVQGME
jgi:uncharacterized cysteine cluster protein YcgN (CxxCxxCC family)